MKGTLAYQLCRFCWFAAGIIKGQIKLEGHDKEQGPFARVSGYVEQVTGFESGELNHTMQHAVIVVRSCCQRL